MPTPNGPVSLSELLLGVVSSSATDPGTRVNREPATPEDPISKVAQLAARLLHAPLGTVSLPREYYTRCAPSPSIEPSRYDRAASIGAHVLMGGTALIVNDISADPRFASHHEVTDLGIRAFAGVPIMHASGVVIGALKVRDTRARLFTSADVETLNLLAGFVSRELELREISEALVQHEADCRAARPLTSRCVLVVGKDNIARRLLQDWLAAAGALVDTASPGVQADERLRDSELVGVPYGVIVVEGESGPSVSELCARANGVAVVAVCHACDDADALRASGCDDVVVSPLDRSEALIEACVREVGKVSC